METIPLTSLGLGSEPTSQYPLPQYHACRLAVWKGADFISQEASRADFSYNQFYLDLIRTHKDACFTLLSLLEFSKCAGFCLKLLV